MLDERAERVGQTDLARALLESRAAQYRVERAVDVSAHLQEQCAKQARSRGVRPSCPFGADLSYAQFSP
eukprot:1242930-Pleurochrysis_carterae.AAC.6